MSTTKLSTKDISNLLLFTPQGVNKWKKEQRPIIALLEKYFSKEDLIEFLETGKIQKLERLQELEEIERKYNTLIEAFKTTQKD